MTALRVRRVGLPVLVQDAGRPGRSGIGVGRSGAADRGSYALANRLVGNTEGAAVLEITLGGLELEVRDGTTWLALTGASAVVRVDGRAHPPGTLVVARSGAVVAVGVPGVGLRSYLAVRGGLDLPTVLGSRSRDVLAGIGPEPLREGDVLPVGREVGAEPEVDAVALPRWDAEPVLRLVRGPRDGLVADADALVTTRWTVSDRSNRVGARLDADTGTGDPPSGLTHLAEAADLPSEGVLRGAVQIPPGGEPVVFLADHPVTGGYPVVGVVVDADVDRAAQLRPGDRVRFGWR